MSDLAANIANKDEIKLLKKKIQILKQAVRSERKQKQELQKIIQYEKQKNWKTEHQLKKKEEKNQTLLAEIRQLKDSLVVERNQKQKFVQQLAGLKKTGLNNNINPDKVSSGNNSTMSSYLYFWK